MSPTRSHLASPLAGAVIALAAAFASTATAEERDPARDLLAESWPIAGATALHFEMPVGELTLVATDGTDVRASVESHCWHDDSDCVDAEDYRFTSRRAGNRLLVKLRGPRFQFTDDSTIEVRVEVPRSLLLDVDVGIGEVTLSGFERGTDVALGIGEVSVRSPRASVRNVRMHVGLGEANLDYDGRSIERVSVFGSGIHWKAGPGRSTVAVKLGIGEASVVLD